MRSVWLGIFSCFCLVSFSFGNMISLDQLKEHHNKRYDSFMYLFFLLAQTKPKVIVETGTIRQGKLAFRLDGASTLLFAEFAHKLHCDFYSVDHNIDCIELAKRTCQEMFGQAFRCTFSLGDSIEFLKQFTKPIDCLYLDSYEFDFSDPTICQEHFLQEINAAYPKLSESCVVVFDDCDLPKGGQGAKAIAFLKQQGWKVKHEGCQVIMMRE